MPDQEPTYDVAISFLSADQSTAQALADRLSGTLNVFFYPRSQEALAGTNGLESMRAPFVDECRVAVILFRGGWGNTPWTGIEQVAILDGVLKHGWDRLFFLMLDDTAPLPTWLPNAHIRFSIANFGIEQAVGAIKARAQQAGGRIKPEDSVSRARAVKAEYDRRELKEARFSNVGWIFDNVKQAFGEIKSEIEQKVAEIARTSGIPIRAEAVPNTVVIAEQRVSISLGIRQQYTNRMGDLMIREFHARILFPNESAHYLGEVPQAVKEYIFKPDVTAGGILVWQVKEGGEHMTSAQVGEFALRKYLDLVDSANRGLIKPDSIW